MVQSLSRRARTSLAVFGGIASMAGVVALSFSLPNFAPAQTRPSKPPSQVIYRFDDHRWLELKGWDCEGALWYLDSRHGIRTEVAPQFFRIFFFEYVHPSANYIAIPLDDLSAILVSRDGGRTFDNAHLRVSGRGKYANEEPDVDDVSRFVVVNDQGFLETKVGRLLQSSKPFGDRWGLDYIDYRAPGDEPLLTNYERPNFQNLPSKIPTVSNYHGWTHMRCDPTVGEQTKSTAPR